ncbi:hypothetical protein ACVBEJ_11125 [Porticoccus sp. GXU_MW_L64]
MPESHVNRGGKAAATHDDGFNIKTLTLRISICSIAIIIIAELGLRLFVTAPSRQLFDSEIGWRYIPNSTLVHSGEGYAFHRLNELGMNDGPLHAKTNSHKILVSGDSFVEALEVSRDRNFVSLLDSSHPDIDFINSGRGDFTPIHQPIVLSRLQQHIRPASNLLFISAGDIGALLSSPSQIIRSHKNKILDLKPTSHSKDQLKDKFRVVLHHSALATYIMRRYHRELKNIIGFVNNPCIFNCPEKVDDNAALSTDTHAAREEKINRLSFILKSLNTELPTKVFYIPTVIYSPYGKAYISEFSKNELSIIKKSTNSTKIEFHNLSPVFIKNYRSTGKAAFGFHNTQVGGEGHLNHYGHRIVSEYIISNVELVR